MNDLDFSTGLVAASARRGGFRPPLFLARIRARWTARRQRRQALRETLHELARLDTATLVDSGVLHSSRRAQWVDIEPNLPPRLVVDLVRRTDAASILRSALNRCGEDVRP